MAKRVKSTLDFQDAYSIQADLEAASERMPYIPCTACGGSGMYQYPHYSAQCCTCKGTGRSTNPYDLLYNCTTTGLMPNEELDAKFMRFSRGTLQKDGRRVGILVGWINPKFQHIWDEYRKENPR